MFRLAAKLVADEDGLWHHHLVIAQIGNEGAQRRLTHRKANHQSKCKGAIDKNLSEFRRRRRLCVQMQWLRIMSHRRDETIVCLGDGATDGMDDGVANSPLVELSAAHDAASRTTQSEER